MVTSGRSLFFRALCGVPRAANVEGDGGQVGAGDDGVDMFYTRWSECHFFSLSAFSTGYLSSRTFQSSKDPSYTIAV
jgi:hypothetical protein